jgi:hypothetical protein
MGEWAVGALKVIYREAKYRKAIQEHEEREYLSLKSSI